MTNPWRNIFQRTWNISLQISTKFHDDRFLHQGDRAKSCFFCWLFSGWFLDQNSVSRAFSLEVVLSSEYFLDACCNYYKHPWIIMWGELFSNRYKPQKKRLDQMAWNFAWVHLTIILWDCLLRFLIFSPKAKIWWGLRGWAGGWKMSKNFFFNFEIFLMELVE